MRELLIEKYIKPTLIDEKGNQYWYDNNSLLHRDFGLPAKINCDFDGNDAEWWIRGRYIKTENILSKEEQIKEIFEEFDFEKVRTAMSSVGWGWGLPPKLPTLARLKSRSKRLLNDVFEYAYRLNIEEACSAAGGFKATYYKKYNELKLEFVFERWRI